MTESSTNGPDRSRGRLMVFLGLGLTVLGVVGYIVQTSMQNLMMPWYMPGLSVLGAALVVTSLIMRRSVWRALALVMVVLLASAEIALLYATRLPPYTGPIQVGSPFPAFEAKRSDGTPFTQNDLVGDRNQVLVFFRGRW